MSWLFVAKRRFGRADGDKWAHYIEWSGLRQLREVVSLDQILCPTVPADLVAADWEHNVHADYLASYFRSLDYLKRRVRGEPYLNLLAVLQNPSPADLDGPNPPGFAFLGFDVLDVHGDVSVLTNCGGFDDIFAKSELSEFGLLREASRAYRVQRDLRTAYPDDSHSECDVWAIWRMTVADRGFKQRAT